MFKKAKENKKGFTLAELLIVVAIIAVLVAISIPIFTSQLEKSREAVDLANMRSAYAECSAAVLSATAPSDTTNYTYSNTNGVITCIATVTLTQNQDNWTGSATPEIGGVTLKNTIDHTKAVTITVTDDGSAPKFEQTNTSLAN